MRIFWGIILILFGLLLSPFIGYIGVIMIIFGVLLLIASNRNNNTTVDIPHDTLN